MREFMRRIPLFADLDEPVLERLCALVREVELTDGELLFREGDAGDAAYVVEQGEIEIVKHDAGKEVLLAVRKRGDVIGEMSLLEDAPRMASVRGRGEVKLLKIAADAFDEVLRSSAQVSAVMLHTVVARWRNTEARLRQSDKMAQLGTLTAGLAHELNNPAAAVQRGAATLAELDPRALAADRELHAAGMTDEQRASLEGLDARARKAARSPANLNALERSDRESAVEEVLDEAGVEEAWAYAPTLVRLDLSTDELAEVAARWGARTGALLSWLELAYERAAIVAELHEGASRISELVRSLKMYSYLDQGPVQQVHVHEGLDATLVLLRSRLSRGVEVIRDYDPAVTSIQAYGSELNQVWTNLIVNALDALGGSGTITLRTRALSHGVEVDVEDDGPGIPSDIQGRIFDPFFTTKPPGEGTGLGLDVSYNIVANKHKGALSVVSRPGRTVFTVRLPRDLSEATMVDAPTLGRPTNEVVERILEETRTIAVVGGSDRPGRPAHDVPAYLADHGYRVVQVDGTTVEGFSSVDPKPDLVLIVSHTADVGAAVEGAIAAGARTVWMQDGIVDEAAARRAEEAGLVAVMDACLRNAHVRWSSGPVRAS